MYAADEMIRIIDAQKVVTKLKMESLRFVNLLKVTGLHVEQVRCNENHNVLGFQRMKNYSYDQFIEFQ